VTRRCLLADDSEDFLASATRMLESQGVEAVGSASTGEPALQLAKALQPDVVLVDVEVGDEDGVQLSGQLRARLPSSNVILISANDRDEIAELIAPARSSTFLPKSSLSAAAIEGLIA
jgi:DNA-binding NarL/FixJ family response regulator